LILARVRPSATESGFFVIRLSLRATVHLPNPILRAISVTVIFSIQRSLASSLRSRLYLAHSTTYRFGMLKVLACCSSRLALPSPKHRPLLSEEHLRKT
jgi:hypothetical protein